MSSMHDSSPSLAASSLQELYRLAQAAASRAYAPYSRFRVGAALLFLDGPIVTGCNVENISYGLTICAERSALVRAISEKGHAGRSLAAIAVANLNQAASPPCGACRQVLSEFVTCDAVVLFPGEGGLPGAPVAFRDLFPFAFALGETPGVSGQI